jgi:phosphatidylserine decarboxylase
MAVIIRLGMHLLFYGKEQIKLLGSRKVEEILQEQSVKVLVLRSLSRTLLNDK